MFLIVKKVIINKIIKRVKMIRIIKLFVLSAFLLTSANAEQGTVRMGLELGISPVDMEAEDTAQKIANASGSTVSTEYSTGVLVGRLWYLRLTLW